jgi:hypothetical protein
MCFTAFLIDGNPGATVTTRGVDKIAALIAFP